MSTTEGANVHNVHNLVETAEHETWCISEVDIFRDLSQQEIKDIHMATVMKDYAPGEMLFTPHNPVEMLFILNTGRVRIFRVSPDGRALTTAIISPGTIFGEMVLLGQRMYDSYAEALEPTNVCMLGREEVRRLLLNDARIATRIAEILGRRLASMERKLSDSVFKSVPQRIAGTLFTLARQQHRRGFGSRAGVISLTHEQLAGLAGTSRETATKVLNEFRDQGLLKLGRGKVTVLDPGGLRGQTGEE